jgi:hypothetical protein
MFWKMRIKYKNYRLRKRLNAYDSRFWTWRKKYVSNRTRKSFNSMFYSIDNASYWKKWRLKRHRKEYFY